MRLRLAIVLLCTAALALASCANNKSSSTSSGESKSVKIGVILDITGPAAAIAGPERNAIDLAVKQIAASGKGPRLEVTVADDQSREGVAAQVAAKLVNTDHVDLLIGSTTSGPSLAIRTIAEQAKIPMISLASSSEITSGASWVFKTPPNDNVVITQLVQYMSQQGFHSIGVLRDSSAFGNGVVESINSAGKSTGISVTDSEEFSGTATDFTAQLVKLRSARTDANLIWGSAAAPALATKQYRSLGLNAPLLESYGIASAQFLSTAGDAANGVVLNGNKLLVLNQLPTSDPQYTVLKTFSDGFNAAYSASPSPFAGYAYDAVRLAGDAFAAVGSSASAVRDYLQKVHNYVGVTGVFDYTPQDHSGFPTSPLVVLQIAQGTFELKAS